jgi:Fe-S-cluster formation regulator IscX/YfhJ
MLTSALHIILMLYSKGQKPTIMNTMATMNSCTTLLNTVSDEYIAAKAIVLNVRALVDAIRTHNKHNAIQIMDKITRIFDTYTGDDRTDVRVMLMNLQSMYECPRKSATNIEEIVCEYVMRIAYNIPSKFDINFITLQTGKSILYNIDFDHLYGFLQYKRYIVHIDRFIDDIRHNNVDVLIVSLLNHPANYQLDFKTLYPFIKIRDNELTEFNNIFAHTFSNKRDTTMIAQMEIGSKYIEVLYVGHIPNINKWLHNLYDPTKQIDPYTVDYINDLYSEFDIESDSDYDSESESVGYNMRMLDIVDPVVMISPDLINKPAEIDPSHIDKPTLMLLDYLSSEMPDIDIHTMYANSNMY